MNAQNTINALQAAIDSVKSGDSYSAIDYLAVAAAELCGEDKRPGQGLIFLTEDTVKCVAAGVIEVEP